MARRMDRGVWRRKRGSGSGRGSDFTPPSTASATTAVATATATGDGDAGAVDSLIPFVQSISLSPLPSPATATTTAAAATRSTPLPNTNSNRKPAASAAAAFNWADATSDDDDDDGRRAGSGIGTTDNSNSIGHDSGHDRIPLTATATAAAATAESKAVAGPIATATAHAPTAATAAIAVDARSGAVSPPAAESKSTPAGGTAKWRSPAVTALKQRQQQQQQLLQSNAVAAVSTHAPAAAGKTDEPTLTPPHPKTAVSQAQTQSPPPLLSPPSGGRLIRLGPNMRPGNDLHCAMIEHFPQSATQQQFSDALSGLVEWRRLADGNESALTRALAVFESAADARAACSSAKPPSDAAFTFTIRPLRSSDHATVLADCTYANTPTPCRRQLVFVCRAPVEVPASRRSHGTAVAHRFIRGALGRGFGALKPAPSSADRKSKPKRTASATAPPQLDSWD